MIAHTCRRCGSTNLKKNGHTPSGQQKIHCKNCQFSSTLETQHFKRQLLEQQVAQLSLERMSQRAIARTTGLARMTVAKLQKK